VDHFTGDAYATVTNTLTGKSFARTISGPGTVTTFPDGSFTIDAAGPNLLWTTVANSSRACRKLLTRQATCRYRLQRPVSQRATS
jgi:hypothetical protein